MNIGTMIKRLQDIMRQDAGVNGDAQRIEQIVWMLFLKLYDDIFVDDPHIIQKTDNIGLFAYSLSSLSMYGYTLINVSLDLENTDIPNVITEYEAKFMSLGTKINYLEAVKYTKK